MNGTFVVEGEVLKHYGIPGMKKGYHKGVLWNRELVAKPEDYVVRGEKAVALSRNKYYDRTDDAVRSDRAARSTLGNVAYDLRNDIRKKLGKGSLDTNRLRGVRYTYTKQDEQNYVKKRAAATNPYYDANYVNTRGGNSTTKNFLTDLNEYGGLMSKDPYSSTRQEKKEDRINKLQYGTTDPKEVAKKKAKEKAEYDKRKKIEDFRDNVIGWFLGNSSGGRFVEPAHPSYSGGTSLIKTGQNPLKKWKGYIIRK